MADKKISELDAITGANTAATDVFVVVDTSTGQTKKITREELNNAIERDVLSTINIDGGTIDNTVIGGTTSAAGSFTNLNIAPSSGFGYIEMGGASGAYIDMKAPFSDDYDGRIIHDGSNLALVTSSGGGNLLFQVANQTKMSVISTGIDVTGGITTSDNITITKTNGAITIQDATNNNLKGQIQQIAGRLILRSRNDTSNGNITFEGHNSQEYARFNASGYLGIGTSSNLNDQFTVGTSTDGFTANVSGAVTTIRLGAHDTSGYAGRFDYDRATGLLTYKEGPYNSEGSALLAVTNSGNVGIGITPTAKFHVGGTIQSQTGSSVAQMYTDGGAAYFSSVGAYPSIFLTNGSERMRITSGGEVQIGTSTSDTNKLFVYDSDASNSVIYVRQDGAGPIQSWHGSFGTERMRITSSGQVGINSTTPSSLLTVGNGDNYTLGSTSGDILNAFDLVYDTTNSDYLRFYAKRESNGSTWEQAKHVIERQIDATKMGQIKFGSHTVDPISFGNNNTEFARFDGSANLLVGKTTTALGVTGARFSSDGYFSLDRNFSSTGDFGLMNQSGSSTNNNFHFCTGGTVRGTIRWSNTSTSYITTSDYRLKENVTGITDGIERVKQLNPSRFNFIADADTTVDGFLAHEAQTVVPEAVTGEKDAVDADGNPEYQGIDQAKLVPLLTAALQEAITKIEDLEARVATLEGN